MHYYRFKIFLLVWVVFLSTACTHLHVDRVPTNYKKQALTNIDDTKYNIQIIITRGPFYFTHSAIRLRNHKQTLFWDPSGSYGTDEYEDYFKANPLPDDFIKKEDLITQGVPSLSKYWMFAQFTEDLGMEVFQWNLTEPQATHYQTVFLQGATNSENRFDFTTGAAFYLCSSTLTRFINRFVSDVIPLGETFFFPDNLAHKLYTLRPDRIVMFRKGQEPRVFQPD